MRVRPGGGEANRTIQRTVQHLNHFSANRSKGDRLHKVTEAGSAPTRRGRVCGLSVTDARMLVFIKSAHKYGNETRWSFLSEKIDQEKKRKIWDVTIQHSTIARRVKKSAKLLYRWKTLLMQICVVSRAKKTYRVRVVSNWPVLLEKFIWTTKIFPKQDSVLCWEPDYFNKRKLYNHLKQKKNCHVETEENCFRQHVLGFVIDM